MAEKVAQPFFWPSLVVVLCWKTRDSPDNKRGFGFQMSCMVTKAAQAGMIDEVRELWPAIARLQAYFKVSSTSGSFYKNDLWRIYFLGLYHRQGLAKLLYSCCTAKLLCRSWLYSWKRLSLSILISYLSRFLTHSPGPSLSTGRQDHYHHPLISSSLHPSTSRPLASLEIVLETQAKDEK